MNKITMDYGDYSKMLNACYPALSDEAEWESLQRIEISHDGSGTAYATATDGTIMTQRRFRCEGDAGTFLMQPVNVRNFRPEMGKITIAWDDATVDVSDGKTTVVKSTCRKKDVNRLETARALTSKERRYKIYVDPNLLKRALKGYGSETSITLEFAGSLDGIIMRGEKTCGVVLPQKRYGNDKSMTFYGEAEKR